MTEAMLAAVIFVYSFSMFLSCLLFYYFKCLVVSFFVWPLMRSSYGSNDQLWVTLTFVSITVALPEVTPCGRVGFGAQA